MLVVEPDTPDAVVDGLDAEAVAVRADEPDAASVTVTMTVTGKSGNTLAPQDKATRAEAAAILQRYLQTADK